MEVIKIDKTATQFLESVFKDNRKMKTEPLADKKITKTSFTFLFIDPESNINVTNYQTFNKTQGKTGIKTRQRNQRTLGKFLLDFYKISHKHQSFCLRILTTNKCWEKQLWFWSNLLQKLIRITHSKRKVVQVQ